MKNNKNTKRPSGVYTIVNLITGRIYIGSSVDVYARMKKHFRILSIDKHHNLELQKDYKKYGKDAFEASVFAFCDEINVCSLEEQTIFKALRCCKSVYNKNFQGKKAEDIISFIYNIGRDYTDKKLFIETLIDELKKNADSLAKTGMDKIYEMMISDFYLTETEPEEIAKSRGTT